MRVLHFADLHLGSGLHHGRINPETGLNTRLEDFVASLRACVDAAVSLPVDLVLFGGDAFPDATPPPLHQDLFAQQIRRLADARIPVVLLVGNHDQYGQGQEGSSLSLYRTLGVPGVIVGDQLTTHRLHTAAGPVQVTTLPWINRSTLLARQDTLPSPESLDQVLLQRLSLALEAEIRQLTPQIPAILLAHVMVDRAQYGSERHLAVGKGFTIPLSLLSRPEYAYVGLGHVHRHQVLSDHPPVIYPGSPERVDFGEEHEQKGYILVTLQPGHPTQYEFIPLPARPFRTIRLDCSQLPPGSPDLLTYVQTSLQQARCDQAIVRVFYRHRPDQNWDPHLLHQLLSSAFSYTLHPETQRSSHQRLPHLGHGDPWQALQDYLHTRPELAPLHQDILTAAAELMAAIPPSLEPREPEDLDDESEAIQLGLL
jgi:exonuclease SbcD